MFNTIQISGKGNKTKEISLNSGYMDKLRKLQTKKIMDNPLTESSYSSLEIFDESPAKVKQLEDMGSVPRILIDK